MILSWSTNRAISNPTGRPGAAAWIRRSLASSERRGMEINCGDPSGPRTTRPTPSAWHHLTASKVIEPETFMTTTLRRPWVARS